MNLARAAAEVFHGGFSMGKAHEVEHLIGGARSLLHKFQHPEGAADEDGLADENFMEDWRNEGKDVWMFSGCADDQTSADTSMQGLATGTCLGPFYSTRLLKLAGAMSWAFIRTMRENPRQSYIQVDFHLTIIDLVLIHDVRFCKTREAH